MKSATFTLPFTEITLKSQSRSQIYLKRTEVYQSAEQ